MVNNMLSGVICADKPAGMTSHDVVNIVKKLSGMKTGHTGTLDPDATGLLPLCLGHATRLAGYMSDSDKEYTVEIIFGTETDTQDAGGTVTREAALTASADEFMAAALSFTGPYDQIPPMYSAIKKGGRKLYELARAGQTVSREPRRVYFHRINILHTELPYRATLSVRCSKGAYMRTLCEDLGRRLDACAHMGTLVRTAAGGFTRDNAYTLDRLRELAAEGLLANAVVPMDEIPALRGLPAMRCLPHADKRLRSGGILTPHDITSTFENPPTKEPTTKEPPTKEPTSQHHTLIYDSTGNLAAIYGASNGRFTPVTMLV